MIEKINDQMMKRIKKIRNRIDLNEFLKESKWSNIFDPVSPMILLVFNFLTKRLYKYNLIQGNQDHLKWRVIKILKY
jgi:hypothetical protein